MIIFQLNKPLIWPKLRGSLTFKDISHYRADLHFRRFVPGSPRWRVPLRHGQNRRSCSKRRRRECHHLKTPIRPLRRLVCRFGSSFSSYVKHFTESGLLIVIILLWRHAEWSLTGQYNVWTRLDTSHSCSAAVNSRSGCRRTDYQTDGRTQPWKEPSSTTPCFTDFREILDITILLLRLCHVYSYSIFKIVRNLGKCFCWVRCFNIPKKRTLAQVYRTKQGHLFHLTWKLMVRNGTESCAYECKLHILHSTQ